MRVMAMGIIRVGVLGALFVTSVAFAQPSEPPATTTPRATAQPAQFASPEEGFAALASAARRRDPVALGRVLGTEGRRLLRSGDEVDDAASLRRFAAAYDEKHAILRPTPDRAMLQVGADEWPLPIPLRLSGASWRFNPREGAQEIVNRRIGRNELDTIQTLRAIVDAQEEFSQTAGREGGLRAYARRFVSSPRRHDGLWWEAAPDRPQSPLGRFVAEAGAQRYRPLRRGEPARPIHGYFFNILEAQGPSAPGGAMSYLVGERMIGGFAVVAWPAEYGASGIQTFMVSHDGQVWQGDFGRDTARAVRGIRAFDPGNGWRPVD